MFKGINYLLRSIVKKPFKIGMITPQYSEKNEKTNKGVAIHVENLSKNLANLGAEVHIFTSGKKNSKKEEYIGDGKRVVHRVDTQFNLPVKDFMIEKNFSTFLFNSKIIDQMLKENHHANFDIIHSHITMSGALMTKYFTNIKWIHTFHSLEKNRLKFMSKEEQRYFKFAKWNESAITQTDAIIAVSDRLKLEILQNYPMKENKVFTIHNGVDISEFKPENTKTNDKQILYIGRFSEEKGIDIVVGIVEEIIKHKEVKFVLVAPPYKIMPESMQKIKNKLEELEKKYPESIVWIKVDISRDEIKNLYNESTILINPSRYDSFPTTVLEAMACGKAVIVSNKGGMPEMVENAGIIVPLKKGHFIKSILRLLDDFRLRERYSKRALERAKIFDWEEISKKTLTLYKVVSGKIKKGEDKYDFKKS